MRLPDGTTPDQLEPDHGAVDFVNDIAINLPLLAIADLIGVPEADRESCSNGRTRS